MPSVATSAKFSVKLRIYIFYGVVGLGRRRTIEDSGSGVASRKRDGTFPAESDSTSAEIRMQDTMCGLLECTVYIGYRVVSWKRSSVSVITGKSQPMRT